MSIPQSSAMPTNLFAILILSVAIISCQKEVKMDVTAPDHHIVLHFKPVVQYDTVALAFDTVTYENFFNEPFTVKAFKFYIHGIELMNTDSNKAVPIANDQYYLIDFADTNSTQIKFSVSSYKYNRLAFTLGVDSALNVSGAQTGALDPAKGMFWTWNTGYIMAKLEGTSPVSTAPSHLFEYHIGGFKQAESVIKKITLSFPLGGGVDMKTGQTTTIHITADAYDWFHNPHDIRISDHPAVMTPGALSQQVAENYSKMFTVVEINNQ